MDNEKSVGLIWDDYSIKFNEKLIYQCNGDWEKLDQNEREIAALWKLYVDINNGGFEQFFCNWGYDCYWSAMRGFQLMGYRELLDMFHNTYMEVFDKFREDERLTYYSDILQYLTDEDDAILMETNTSFWETYGDELAERAYKFYHDELKITVK